MLPCFHVTSLMILLQLFAFCTTKAVASCNEGQYASCTFTDAVQGKSPGSNIGNPSAASLEACHVLCCANAGCLAVIYWDSGSCFLLGRTYDGNFQSSDASVVSNRVTCSTCGMGQYQNLNAHASTSCKTCDVGQYAATATASACSSCAAGEYQPSNPSITYNCLACESNCQACTDETTCTTCNSGYSKRLGNCYPTCGSGYTLHGPYYTATCKITCDDPNCETCDPADTCTTCSAGNPIPTSSGGCLPPDADKDGIPDYIECPDPTDCVDTDSDGVPDKSDDDSDNDGINDAQEAGMTMTPAEIKCALSAYHDQGSCGCGANDQQSDWCGPSHAGICPQTKSVATSICSSGKAVLNTYHQKAATIAERTFYDNCIYMFLAQVSLRFRLFLFLLSLG